MAKTTTKTPAVQKVEAKKVETKVETKKVEKKADAQKSVADLQKELVVKRMELMMGKLKDVRSISKTQDEIARLKTLARMKELTTV
jgi:ribosomal protein L29